MISTVLINRLPSKKSLFILLMALTSASPFSYIDVYGVEHPTFGALKCTSRTSSVKHKTTSHKPQSDKFKKIDGGSSRKSVRVTTSVTLGTHKKKKKKSTRDSAKSNETRTINQGSLHSMKHPSVACPTTSLARVDRDSPVQRVSSSQSNLWTRGSRIPSETSSGYEKSRSNSRTAISNPSVVAHSTMSTTDVLLSMNKSQDNLQSKILTSPIKVSLKRGIAQAASFRRTVNGGPSRRPPSQGPGGGRGGETLTVEEIVWGLSRLQYRNVIVMSGAGISTSSGIPDFRSPGTGLYDNLQQYKVPDPTAIFDIGYFSRNPKPFFTLARELYPGKYKPNTVHHFVRLLQEKGLLLRNYTQNIDGLERIAGITPSKLMEAHGSFSTVSCIKCTSKQDPDQVKATIFNGKIPRCKHKYCLGLVKPDIVFFGEDLPARFHSLQLRDFSKCDLLIIMGTSLEVEPFSSLCTLPRFDVPRLLINRELVGPFKQSRKRSTDVALTGDLVDSVREVIEQAGWTEDLRLVTNGASEQEEEVLPDSDSIDVQTVASEDDYSTISTESDPVLLPHTTESDPVLLPPTTGTSDVTSVLTSQMIGLTIESKISLE